MNAERRRERGKEAVRKALANLEGESGGGMSNLGPGPKPKTLDMYGEVTTKTKWGQNKSPRTKWGN